MKIWIDTEFLDDGKTIDLISIGLIRQDNQTYYAESSEYDYSRSTEWLLDNVHTGLKGREFRKSRSEIALDIVNFCGDSPEFWGWYCSYDWVALCQLYGPMIAIPSHWPKYCMDVKMLARMLLKDVEMESVGVAHNALDDAKRIKNVHWKLLGLAQ